MPPGQTRSTSSGRCGPCCSTAPHGTMHTLPISTASLISGQVSFSYRYSSRARLVIGGGLRGGGGGIECSCKQLVQGRRLARPIALPEPLGTEPEPRHDPA